jgi:selenocysteine-specific elongation factor
MARTRIIGQADIQSGSEGFVQLALEAPVAALRGDRFILRRPSPAATLGGGTILDPHPGRRHRRYREQSIERLQTLAQGTPEELVLQALTRIEPAARQDLVKRSGLDHDSAEGAIDQLLASGEIIPLNNNFIARLTWHTWANKAETIVRAYHREYPLRVGMPREELRSRLKLKANVFNPFFQQVTADGALADAGAFVQLTGHTILFSAEQQAAIDRQMRRFAAAGINSPSVKETRAAIGDNVYDALLQLGELRQISADVVWRNADYAKFTNTIYNYLLKHDTINAAEVRDQFQTSRKYAIALLEHLDDIKVTRRVGDARELIRRR